MTKSSPDCTDPAVQALLTSGLRTAAARGFRPDATPPWLAQLALPGADLHRLLAGLADPIGTAGDTAAIAELNSIIETESQGVLVPQLAGYLAALLQTVGGGDPECLLAFCVMVRQGTMIWVARNLGKVPGLLSLVAGICEVVPPEQPAELAAWLDVATPIGTESEQLQSLMVLIGNLLVIARHIYGDAAAPTALHAEFARIARG